MQFLDVCCKGLLRPLHSLMSFRFGEGKEAETPSKRPKYAMDAFVLPALMACMGMYHSVTPVNARLLLEFVEITVEVKQTNQSQFSLL